MPERRGAAPAEGSELLRLLLEPRCVALIGASRDEASITARPLRYLDRLGYGGEVVVVNPGAVPRLGRHPAVATVAEAASAEVALVLVDADRVLPALEECAEAGIRAAIVIASGFEGTHGGSRREALERFLAETGMRVVGPNCNGVAGTAAGSYLTFSSVLLDRDPRPGAMALVSQSGAIGNGLLHALLRRFAGLHSWFSTGDELDVGALEIACALLGDDACGGVALFLEGITDLEHLEPLGAAIADTGKPVLALRGAVSDRGREAAFGHTGRVVGDDRFARAALRSVGVRLVPTLADLADAVTILSRGQRFAGGRCARVGVVSVSGGMGVLAADAIAGSRGLELADLDSDRAAMEAAIGGGVRVTNPMDVGNLGDRSVLERTITPTLGAAPAHAVRAVVTRNAPDNHTHAAATYPPGTPLVYTHLSPEERFSDAQTTALAAKGVTCLPSVASAVAALDIWAGGGAGGSASSTRGSREPAAASGQLGILGTLGRFPGRLDRWVPTAVAVDDAQAAHAAAAGLGGRVVVKADGARIAHRTELGAVRVGVLPGPELAEAFADVQSACAAFPGERVIVQRMARPGVELLVSVAADPEIGPCLVCALGGVGVELGGPQAVLAASPDRWTSLLRDSALGPVLAGWRGAPPLDVDALVELARALAGILAEDPAVAGIECNPVLVGEAGHGVAVADLIAFLR